MERVGRDQWLYLCDLSGGSLADSRCSGTPVAGHDWEPNPSRKHHGVYQAVNEFIKENSYEVIYLDEATQWCIRKK